MKKIILATLLIGMMSNCEKPKKGVQSKILYDFDDFDIAVVDSCEYVVKLSNGHFVHKANCKNNFHKGGNK